MWAMNRFIWLLSIMLRREDKRTAQESIDLNHWWKVEIPDRFYHSKVYDIYISFLSAFSKNKDDNGEILF